VWRKWRIERRFAPDLTFVRRSPSLSPWRRRENGILVIAASIIAVIRLRGEPIKPSSKLTATIADSVQLARMGFGSGGGESVSR
jgi:hypothetical protein